MPELPEVEITTRNLNKILSPPVKVDEFQFFRENLRNRIPVKKIKQLEGCAVLNIFRRAKFIVFEFESGSIVSHLGMTGSWRLESAHWDRRTHDHIAMRFNKNQFIVYNDPRRFGEFDYFPKGSTESRFLNLGPEPLGDIDWSLITKQFKSLQSPIKSVLMNQKYLVGVGNIYASEALFRAEIRPQRKANRITYDQYEKLWAHIQFILQQAIAAGGSSIQDFRNGYGERGDFQNHFLVYDREGAPCKKCGAGIKSIFISGRSTYWCPVCQK